MLNLDDGKRGLPHWMINLPKTNPLKGYSRSYRGCGWGLWSLPINGGVL